MANNSPESVSVQMQEAGFNPEQVNWELWGPLGIFFLFGGIFCIRLAFMLHAHSRKSDGFDRGLNDKRNLN